MKNSSKSALLVIVAMALLAYHALVIADDVRAVIQDPNQDINRARSSSWPLT